MSARDMRKKSRTDWAKIKAMKDQEIDLSETPELDDRFFTEAALWPGKKKQITIRVDPDVLDFFKQTGRGYQSVINSVLRRFMEAHQRRQKSG
jgi:uncharacterized protein (DUF4415 family)